MDIKSIVLIVATVGTALVLSVSKVHGSPITFQAKPPMCPYGKCYIDRCERICLCVPHEGNTTCTKEYEMPGECSKHLLPGNCPLGKMYKNPLWNEHFVCYCNEDSSQTYECFDLSKQTPAEAHELLNSLRRNRNKISQKTL